MFPETHLQVDTENQTTKKTSLKEKIVITIFSFVFSMFLVTWFSVASKTHTLTDLQSMTSEQLANLSPEDNFFLFEEGYTGFTSSNPLVEYNYIKKKIPLSSFLVNDEIDVSLITKFHNLSYLLLHKGSVSISFDNLTNENSSAYENLTLSLGNNNLSFKNEYVISFPQLEKLHDIIDNMDEAYLSYRFLFIESNIESSITDLIKQDFRYSADSYNKIALRFEQLGDLLGNDSLTSNSYFYEIIGSKTNFKELLYAYNSYSLHNKETANKDEKLLQYIVNNTEKVTHNDLCFAKMPKNVKYNDEVIGTITITHSGFSLTPYSCDNQNSEQALSMAAISKLQILINDSLPKDDFHTFHTLMNE